MIVANCFIEIISVSLVSDLMGPHGNARREKVRAEAQAGVQQAALQTPREAQAPRPVHAVRLPVLNRERAPGLA